LALALLAGGAAPLSGQVTGASQPPPATPAPRPLDLPPIELRKLGNGIEVAVMRDTGTVVSIGVVLDVGPAVEPADKPGLGDFVKAMLNLGTTSRTADAIADAAKTLHGRVTSTFLYAPSAKLDHLLPLLADQLLHPVFADKALEQLKANAAAGARRAADDPRFVAPAVFKAIFYGVQHPYGREQTEASIASITRDDVVAFYRKYICPPNVRFAVVGDIDPDSAVAKLERHFGAWRPGTSAQVAVPAPAAPSATTVYLYDVPNASQSNLWIGGLGLRRDAPDYAAVSVMNAILGGSPRSRLVTSLGREHDYTRKVQTGFAFRPVPEPGTFATLAAVPTAKTDSALIEVMRELQAFRGARPATAEEFETALTQMRRQLPLELATVSQRVLAIMDLLSNKLPLDYFDTVSAKLAGMTLADVQAAARAHVAPDQLAIVVVGDRATLEAGLRAANLAPVVVVDRNGTPRVP
jgi:predicted Zn-dependent peptidase